MTGKETTFGLLLVILPLLSAINSASATKNVNLETIVNQLETDRGSFDFISSTNALIGGGSGRPSDVKYQDDTQVMVATTVETDLLDVTSTMNIDTTSEMIVANISNGGQKVEVVTTHIVSDMDAFGLTTHCDSSDMPESSSNIKDKNIDDMGFEDMDFDALMCLPLYDLVGSKQFIQLDQEGNIIEVSGPGTDMLKALMGSGTGNDHGSAASNKLGASENIQGIQRLLSILPQSAVQPGDSWSVNVDMGDAVGNLDGTAKLLGYYPQFPKENGGVVDVAVIVVDGILHIDMSKIMGALGMDMDASLLDSKPAIEGSIQETIVWDYKNGFARLVQLTTDMTLEQQNPIDGSTMEIPVHEVMTMATTILEDNRKASEQSFTFTSSQAVDTSSKGKTAFVILFFLVAGVSIPFVVFAIRRRYQSRASRRPHEFTTLNIEEAEMT